LNGDQKGTEACTFSLVFFFFLSKIIRKFNQRKKYFDEGVKEIDGTSTQNITLGRSMRQLLGADASSSTLLLVS